MKVRPIIMGAESVQAILEERKTMTRRVIKPHPSVSYHWSGDAYEEGGMVKAILSSKPTIHFDYLPNCPYGKVGDRLWVRETWATLTYHEGDVPIHIVKDNKNIKHDVVYYAECPDFSWMDGDGFQEYRKDGMEASHWKSPIYMPHWASRITLEITDIRVERVQDISAKDAIAEGIPAPYVARDEFEPISMYQKQWNKLNAKRGYPWESNPWVWVISFKKVHDQKEG